MAGVDATHRPRDRAAGSPHGDDDDGVRSATCPAGGAAGTRRAARAGRRRAVGPGRRRSGLRPVTRRWPAAVLGSAAVRPRATEVAARHRPARRLGRRRDAARRGAWRHPAGRVGLGATGGRGGRAARARPPRPRRRRGPRPTPCAAELGPLELPARGRIVRRILRAVLARHRYATARDLAYGPDPANVLDVWRHPALPRDARAPVLLQIHGGAWSSGSKAADAHPLMAAMVGRGWVCVTVDYRLGPAERWPAHDRRRQAGAGLDPRPHRRARRRPGPPRDHRRLLRRPPRGAGGAHPGRVAAGLRRRRHLGGRRGLPLRHLRPDQRRRQRHPRRAAGRDDDADRAGRGRPPLRRRVAGGARARRRPTVHGAARHRRRDRRAGPERAPSSRGCGRCRAPRWCTPSSPTPSTASTSCPPPAPLATVRAIAPSWRRSWWRGVRGAGSEDAAARRSALASAR